MAGWCQTIFSGIQCTPHSFGRNPQAAANNLKMHQKERLEKIKSDFPIFNRKIHTDQRLVYLDSAATSQKPEQVIQAMDDFYRNSNANIHRGIHELAEEATGLYEDTRLRIARFLKVEDARQIIFTATQQNPSIYRET
jgi:cysteine desulfurase/selenocysteine lyase